MQNKIIRYLHHAPSRTHLSLSHFKSAKMLPVEIRVKQIKLNHVHRVTHRNAPSYIAADRTLLGSSGHNTRSVSLSYFVPRVKSSGESSFIYTGIREWNKLSTNLQLISEINSFNANIKQFLWLDLENQYKFSVYFNLHMILSSFLLLYGITHYLVCDILLFICDPCTFKVY